VSRPGEVRRQGAPPKWPALDTAQAHPLRRR